MARAIDQDEVLYQLERLRLDAKLKDECEEEAIKRCMAAVKLVPTLTPPNEWVSVENALPPAEGRNMKRYSESLEQWEQEAYYDGYGADCGGRGNWHNPFCPNCGRAMTPEAWAELEKRIGGAV